MRWDGISWCWDMRLVYETDLAKRLTEKVPRYVREVSGSFVRIVRMRGTKEGCRKHFRRGSQQ
jgi:hypothetical protein